MDNDFVVIDFMGSEVLIGDTIAISRKEGTRARLFAGVVTGILEHQRSVKLYYKYVCNPTFSGFVKSKDTYLILSKKDSGKPSDQFVKIDGVEFSINQKRFARLLVEKSDVLAGNKDRCDKTSEEVEDE